MNPSSKVRASCFDFPLLLFEICLSVKGGEFGAKLLLHVAHIMEDILWVQPWQGDFLK